MKNSGRAKKKSGQSKKKSGRAKKQLLGPKTASGTREDSLSRLPDELLLDIAEYLLDDLIKSEMNHLKKINQGIALNSGKKTSVWIYQHNPESPIMTSFQAFSVVNRRTYSICRPIIWRSLKFSSEISTPMSFWYEEILPKHGSYVKVVDVGLRSEWLQMSTAKGKNQYRLSLRSSGGSKIKFIEQNKDFEEVDSIHSDNLDISGYHRTKPDDRHNLLRFLYGLSSESLTKVLDHCPKLTTLRLNCPDDGRDPVKEEMFNLSRNLVSLLSGFGHLQHLTIRGPQRTTILANCFIELIKHLPLLESLELAYVSMGDGSEFDKLPTCISNLKNLKQLILKDVDLFDSSWAWHKSPPHLVNLVIHDCFSLRISDMPWLIENWVPQLTHFELKFHNEVSDIDHNLPIFDPVEYQISLPALTHLTIWPNDDCPFIRSFADCKTLCHLKVYQLPNYDAIDYLSDMESEELSEISDFLTTHVFPNLKTVALHIDYDIWGLDSASVNRLKSMCRSKGIRFSTIAENAKEKLLHNPMEFSC